MLTREEAWNIVTEFTESETLRRHMLAVESAMRHYAPQYNGDPELWGIVGLLHDFDYEKYPDVAVEGHPVVGSKILEERGVSEEIRRAILSHAPEITGIEPQSDMEKVLYAVDELTGFLIAVALVRPSKDIREVKWKSIKKKWKSAAFAAGVSREHIESAAQALGIELQDLAMTTLEALQKDAEALGVAGNNS
ncbi:MAG: HD domain-containing protein [Chloroflexota bacterium]